METKLERILGRVQKPARYTGGELNQTVKDKSAVSTRVAFCFPDIYEIGMSNLGARLLYGLLNDMDGVWCERVFAPWSDMETELRAEGLSLYGLESGDPISEFDILAFSLGYELSYTNVLNMLDLSGLPLRSNDRPRLAPLVIAGGACCYNPEPLADFIDLFVIGEGEEVVVEIIDAYNEAKRQGCCKDEFLLKAAKIEGVYVPRLYDVSYNDDGTVREISPDIGASFPVIKRIVRDFDGAYFPKNAIVPLTEIVHDRVVLELFRGCARGCRFCQAGHTGRPVRERSPARLTRQGADALKSSGYDEITLSSLSTSDYSRLLELCDGLLEYCEPRRISLSLPSLRADNFSVQLMGRAQKVRKSGLTFAPEAGSQRLRDVINKNVTEEDLLSSCRVAFEGGWSSVKLYFMLGLPTETDEDVLAIAELTSKVLGTWKRHAANKNRGVRITVSTSCFVPKPHTPFQWEPQVGADEYLRRVGLLRSAMRNKAITYHWHESDTSFIEAVLARGDRRVGGAVEEAFRRGARLDSWGEHFSLERWLDAFRVSGINPAFYAYRERDEGEILPWSVTSAGLGEDFLCRERRLAHLEKTSPDCREGCAGCSVNGVWGLCRE